MPDWIDIANAAELPEGGRLCAAANGKALVVFNVAGSLYAVANQCPHAGRPLQDSEVRGLTITCPFHGYAYNLKNGNNLDHPDLEPPVPTYRVRIEGDKVQVCIQSITEG